MTFVLPVLRSHISQQRRHISDTGFLGACAVSLAVLTVGVILNFYSGTYATEIAGNFVPDIVLSNTPAFDVDGLFVIGTFVLVIFTVALVLAQLRWLPFTAASLGVFYILRALFVSLTHIGPFPDRVALDWGTIVSKFIGGSDLFFSGHTGAPFLLALIFWKIPVLRNIFLAWSVFFAAIVLLGHLHYSIDVLAAFFITYAIFHIAELLFKKYRAIFNEGIPS